MKNILKLSLLTVGIALSSSVMAQEVIKKEASSTETPKAIESKTDKQDPAKAKPAAGSSTSSPSKTDSKSDTTPGGTRMAITEQGMPKKNKNKNNKTSTAPPATKDAPKK